MYRIYLNNNKVSIGIIKYKLNRLRNKLIISKIECPEVIKESIFYISRFVKVFIMELGLLRIRTLGLPIYLLIINLKRPNLNYYLPSSVIVRLNFLLLLPDRIWVR